MRIALDVMECDFAPDVNIEGIKLALNELNHDLTLVLIGDEQEINPLVECHEISDKSRNHSCT